MEDAKRQTLARIVRAGAEEMLPRQLALLEQICAIDSGTGNEAGNAAVTGLLEPVLSELGAREIITISRSGENNYQNLDRHADAQIIVNATLNVGSAVLYEAGLSFLGLGDPNIMSWGLLIGSSRDYIFDAWWAATLPGLIIFITSLSICLVGDGLTTALNPKLRKL